MFALFKRAHTPPSLSFKCLDLLWLRIAALKCDVYVLPVITDANSLISIIYRIFGRERAISSMARAYIARA